MSVPFSANEIYSFFIFWLSIISHKHKWKTRFQCWPAKMNYQFTMSSTLWTECGRKWHFILWNKLMKLCLLQCLCTKTEQNRQTSQSHSLAGNTSKCLVGSLWSEVQHADHLTKLRGVPVVDVITNDGQLPTNLSCRSAKQKHLSLVCFRASHRHHRWTWHVIILLTQAECRGVQTAYEIRQTAIWKSDCMRNGKIWHPYDFAGLYGHWGTWADGWMMDGKPTQCNDHSKNLLIDWLIEWRLILQHVTTEQCRCSCIHRKYN